MTGDDYNLFDLMVAQGKTNNELAEHFTLEPYEVDQLKRATPRRFPGRPQKVPVRGGRTVCPECKEIKPLTDEHFHRRSATKRGYAITCKLCAALPKVQRGEISGDAAREASDLHYYRGRLQNLGFEEYDRQYSRSLRRLKAMKRVRDQFLEHKAEQEELRRVLEED